MCREEISQVDGDCQVEGSEFFLVAELLKTHLIMKKRESKSGKMVKKSIGNNEYHFFTKRTWQND